MRFPVSEAVNHSRCFQKPVETKVLHNANRGEMFALPVHAIRAMITGRNSFSRDGEKSARYANQQNYLQHRSLEPVVSETPRDCLICSFKEFKDE